MKNLAAAVLAAIFASCALPASAATITQTIAFSATNFFAFGAYPVPVDPVSGSLTVTYDPSVQVQYVSSGVTLHGINIPLDTNYPLQLFNFPALGEISFSTHAGPVIPGMFTFVLQPGIGSGVFEYTTLVDPKYLPFNPDGYGQFYTTDVTYTVTQTPIPSAFLLFVSAMAGLGLIARRRRAVAAA